MGLVAVVAIVAVAFNVDLGPPTSGSDDASGTSIVIGGSPLLDKPAPGFTLATDSGQEVSLAAYRGRPVIVNFWASTCVPCTVEFPLFKAALTAHADDQLTILGVVYKDTASAARAFMTQEDATWPMLLDPGSKIAAAYKVEAIPMSFYVDPQGIVRYVSFGPPPAGTIDEELARMLGRS
ncbi:MAG TPA: TlpA disulfide reductase family protein [Candidatus Limnocylindrales bacterium]|nr:TlpA disulfide reductase family protein [Candidatus Limnocylindrales bacterium]